MGWLQRWRDRRETSSVLAVEDRTASEVPPRITAPRAAALGSERSRGYAVIDVETTGLAPGGDRILEMAIIATDGRGTIVDEWVSRFNPEGPVGATHIHGIRPQDVVDAPRFVDLVTELNRRLAGRALVAHNARFDLAFLRAEYARAGWELPQLPVLCTLEASRHYLPHLDRRRLPDCCWASGIRLEGAHSALGDARATKDLLHHYLDRRSEPTPLPEHLALPEQAAAVAWPSGPSGATLGPTRRVPGQRAFKAKVSAPPLLSTLDRLSLQDALDEGAPDGSVSYLELLAEVLEDGEISDDEATALTDLAALYELSAEDLGEANRGFLLALAHEALADGKVTRGERGELDSVAQLLGLPAGLVKTVLDHAEAARLARLSAGLKDLPADWPHGEPLRVGDKVVFTGCEGTHRERLEAEAERLGVRVMNSVSNRTAMLVTDGSFLGGKADDARTLGIRTVHPEVFQIMLRYLQPARSTAMATATAIPAQTLPSAEGGEAPAVLSSDPGAAVSPALVRQWARDNGYQVGVRGRMPADVVAAYEAAHTA